MDFGITLNIAFALMIVYQLPRAYRPMWYFFQEMTWAKRV